MSFAVYPFVQDNTLKYSVLYHINKIPFFRPQFSLDDKIKNKRTISECFDFWKSKGERNLKLYVLYRLPIKIQKIKYYESRVYRIECIN